jgi:hypothetical protein
MSDSDRYAGGGEHVEGRGDGQKASVQLVETSAAEARRAIQG